MKIQTIGLFIALFAATEASPSPNTAFSDVNDCGDSSFTGETSGGSPKASDCQQLARNIAGGGSWSVADSSVQRQLAQYGTCAFGARLVQYGPTHVGNEDIIGLITDSISKFQSNGLVGAKGGMNCGGSDVAWAIYHT